MVARERAKDDHDRQVTLAWQIEALHRAKKLPELKTLLARYRRQRQSTGQMRSMLHLLAEQHGGVVVRGKKTPKVVSGIAQKGRRGE